jgi:glycosyltransferase involved in cell wall biosynthesis
VQILKVTVFTPTYNRAHIIEQLYRSLQRQTCFDFEWLVVDDGSQDHTDTLFDGWRAEENSFPIRYFKKENGGKCSAINYGLELAQGELFFTVDSDDYLTDDAIEKVIFWEAGLPKDKQYCGLAGNLGTSPTETPNTLFEGPYLDGSALSRYRGIDGERAMVFYTEIHRRYLYPVFPNAFVTFIMVFTSLVLPCFSIVPSTFFIKFSINAGTPKSIEGEVTFKSFAIVFKPPA